MAVLIGVPNVGDGVTIHGWTDAHAYTVVRVSDSCKTIWAQRDKATRTNRADDTFSPGGFMGHTESPRGQAWSYEADPEGNVVALRRGKGGAYYQSGNRTPVSYGRYEHYDYNF